MYPLDPNPYLRISLPLAPTASRSLLIAVSDQGEHSCFGASIKTHTTWAGQESQPITIGQRCRSLIAP